MEESNITHIELNGLNVEEVESVLLGSSDKPAKSRSSGRPIRFGWTNTGRYVAVTYDILDVREGVVMPVTAYEVPAPHLAPKRKRR